MFCRWLEVPELQEVSPWHDQSGQDRVVLPAQARAPRPEGAPEGAPGQPAPHLRDGVQPQLRLRQRQAPRPQPGAGPAKTHQAHQVR